ncbi:hypothetical protein ACIOG8_33810 [Streptomyces erythrochromogenes]|uniref:hypothetical protein n=1 Tax=Streptomyces erythrochromogenes TaxID=285574 RepID=UPI003826C9FA
MTAAAAPGSPAPSPEPGGSSEPAPSPAAGSIPGRTGSGPAPWKGWAAVCAVALGIFCLITSELLPVGLLTPVGADLGVSDGTAGLMVTAPGLIAGFCAPLVTVGAGRLDRRLVLCVLIALTAAGNHPAARLGTRLRRGLGERAGLDDQGCPAATEAASSLMVAVFNLATAAGALFGGLAVDGISAPAAPLGGAALMLVAAVTVWATAIRRRPDRLG